MGNRLKNANEEKEDAKKRYEDIKKGMITLKK